MNLQDYAQSGVISNPTNHAEYLTMVLKNNITSDKVTDAISAIANVQKSISQKDDTCGLTITTGFSANAWQILFPNIEFPKGLKSFEEMKNGDRHFPSTVGDIFFMVKSSRMDLNYQAAKYLVNFFSSIATTIEDIQGFKYLDDRDLIDFVDGTENPQGDLRYNSILVADGTYKGGSFLTVQKYIDKQTDWDALSTEEQEHTIGRTKMDDIEIADEKKKPYAHNVKGKLTINGEEIKMLRQNRSFGNAIEHGTMFIGFIANPEHMTATLKQMITADADGNYDKLLDFVIAKTGANYFVPPQSFLDNIG